MRHPRYARRFYARGLSCVVYCQARVPQRRGDQPSPHHCLHNGRAGPRFAAPEAHPYRHLPGHSARQCETAHARTGECVASSAADSHQQPGGFDHRLSHQIGHPNISRQHHGGEWCRPHCPCRDNTARRRARSTRCPSAGRGSGSRRNRRGGNASSIGKDCVRSGRWANHHASRLQCQGLWHIRCFDA